MSSRIVEVRDAVIARLQAGIALRDSGSAVVTASRQIAAPFDAPTGRTVFVLPLGYSQVEPATRLSDFNEYRLYIVVVDRYSSAGDPSDWADTLSTWTEANVYDPLQVIGVRSPGDVDGTIDPSNLLAGSESGGLWCETAEVLTECDPEILSEHRLFWSELVFSFREVA